MVSKSNMPASSPRRGRDGGERRKSPTGDGFGRGKALRGAAARAHPMVAGGGREVAGVGHGDDLGGSRSSGELGIEATTCRRTGCCTRETLREAAVTLGTPG